MRLARLFWFAPVFGFSLACTGLLGEDTADTSGGPDACKWFRDQDGDGYGDPDKKDASCEKPPGYVANDEDCDDEDPRTHPEGTEVCDDADADEDCDGDVNEDDDSLEPTEWFADADNDDFGDPEDSQRSCDQPSGYVRDDQDCDDDDRDINPDGQEVCDGAGGDEDCDGLVDSDDDSMASSPLPTWYPDDDGDGFGDPDGTTQKQCDAPSGDWATNDDDCDDGDRNVNPDESEVCMNGVDDNCNGSADGCGLTGDISLGSADVKISGTTGSQLGVALCGGGDIDEDGRDDVVVYAYHTTSVGGAYAFYGGATGTLRDSDADVKFSGESGGDSFGRSCALGDLTGDGAADVVIGDSGYDYSSSYSNTGRVYLFSSPLSATETSANTIYTNNTGTSDYIGGTLAIGDWSGDGRNDLFISASGADEVFADYGTISSSSGKDIWGINEFEGALDYSGFLATGGDVDGDGSDDLVAGYAISSVYGERGYIYLMTGEFGGSGLTLSSKADAVLEGDTNTSGVIGSGLSIRGDLNGDGYADLSAGDSAGDGLSSNSGRVHVCFGPWSSGNILDCEVLINGASSSYFGATTEIIGDENGDGEADLLVGAYGATGDVAGSGAAYLFRGPFSAGTLSVNDADASLNGPSGNGYVGATLAAAGDFNGDDLADLLIGGYNINGGAGAAYIVFGGGL